MKATKAYIASLGTTGVVLAASVLMLAVVSAVVGFDGWPKGNVSTRVPTLTLHQKAAPIRVSAQVPARSAARATPRATAAARATSPARNPGGGHITAGLNAPAALPGPVRPIATVPSPPGTAPLQPVQNAANPIIDTIPKPSTTTSRVADGVQGLTDSAGDSLGKVSPQLGDAVAGTGQAAAETIRSLPLP